MWVAVLPTLLLYAHNRRYKSYRNVSQYLKNKYWIIVVGESETIDEYSGETILVPQFVTIPKAEAQILVSTPWLWFLEKSDSIDYRTTNQMLADTVGSLSPLDFQTFDSSNLASSMIAQLGPTATIPYGTASGINPYYGTSIVPESRKGAEKALQFKESTPEFIRDLAPKLGMKPAMLEYYISSFGGMPQDVMTLMDILYDKVGTGKAELPIKSKTGFGVAAELPISGGVLRESGYYGSPQQQYLERQDIEAQTEIETESLREKDLANEVIKKLEEFMSQGADQTTVGNYLNSLGDSLTPELFQKVNNIIETRQSTSAGISKSDETELRARKILNRINEMEQRNASREEVQQFFDDQISKKILTDKVMEKLLEISGIQ